MTHYANYFKDAMIQFRQGQLINFIRSEWISYLSRRRYRRFRKKVQKWENYKHTDKKKIVATLKSGVKLYLFPDSELSKLIYLDRFEKSEQVFMNRLLTQGDIFVDIGANIGLFSLIASKIVGKSGHIYSFEPCSTTYERLQENIGLAHFQNISSFSMALSDQESVLDLCVSKEGFDAWNSFVNPSVKSSFGTESVETISWDIFAQKHSLMGNVTMMKIDVEGWEMQVLQGAANALSRPDAPLLQIEFTEQNCYANGYTCKDLYHQLNDFGYQLFTYDVGENTLVPEPLRETYPHLNVIAVKDLGSVLQRIK